jgi:hypothetical protein
MKTNYSRTADWLHACGKEPGNERDLSVQIGCHIEEFVEFLRCLNVEGPTGASSDVMQEVASILAAVATNIKLQYVLARIYDREMALDALCDCDVTGNGVAFLAGFNKDIADERVLASNRSKFNFDGTPVILEGGKIGKSDLYVPPDLTGLY